MKNMYLAKDYAQKLDSTFLKYRGKVYWCRVDGALLFLHNLWEADGKAVHQISPLDSELDISSIRLGFVNNSTHKMGIYFIREPYRNTKQGVCLRNVTATAIRGHEVIQNAATDNLFDRGASESLNGRYPTLARACEMLTADWSSVAITPELCLTKRADIGEYSVYYKGKYFTGVYDSRTNILNIPASPMATVASHILADQSWVVV